MFDFIDGKIISYDEPEGSRGGGEVTAEGTRRQELDGKIENIKTDKGKRYRIAIGSFSINKENPDYVGVAAITVFDLDTYDEENGYSEGGTYSIYYEGVAE